MTGEGEEEEVRVLSGHGEHCPISRPFFPIPWVRDYVFLR